MNEISALLKRPFSNYSCREKLEIKTLNRPLPDMNMVCEQAVKGKTIVRRVFKRSMYEKNTWICGCAERNALFCFPCVLFGGDDKWTTHGVKDLVHIAASIAKHECTREHLNNVFSFSLIGKGNIVRHNTKILERNEEMVKNRYALNKMINCIRLCSAFELALRGEGGTEKSTKGAFKELINFSAELDDSLADHLKKSPGFKDATQIIQNELLDCMLDVYHEEIINEIKATDYIALIVDEVSDISSQFQLVIVLRYIVKGLPVERFWNFLNPSGHDTASLSLSISAEIDRIIGGNVNKLISQSYDGAVVMNGVETCIKDIYPLANLVHCYSHEGNHIISNATSTNKNVRIFFAELSGLCTFFSKSPERIKMLDKEVRKRLRHPTQTWNFHPLAVNTVHEYQREIYEVLEIIQTSNLKSAIQQATAYKRTIGDDNFLFWLSFFDEIMPHSDIRFNKFQNKYTYFNRIKLDIDSFEKQVLIIRNRKLELYFPSVVLKDLATTDNKRRKTQEFVNQSEFVDVCDKIISLTKDRFSFVGHLAVANLLIAEKFDEYSVCFPHKDFQYVIGSYPFIDDKRLKTELELLYNRRELRSVSGAVSLLCLILEQEIESVFQEMTKLLKILITIPMPTPESERCFTLSKKIKAFLRNAGTEENLSALGMLSYEKVFVNNINNFNNRVIDLFANKKHQRSELIFLNI